MTLVFLKKPIVLVCLAALASVQTYSIDTNGGLFAFKSAAAWAKDKGGNSGGKDSGKGSGSGKGNGKSNGASAGNGRKSQPSARANNSKTSARVERSGNNISVRYRNGIRESIVGTVYEMLDAKGRYIIKRSATNRDRARLAAMAD